MLVLSYLAQPLYCVTSKKDIADTYFSMLHWDIMIVHVLHFLANPDDIVWIWPRQNTFKIFGQGQIEEYTYICPYT